jgi:hypothetical protein
MLGDGPATHNQDMLQRDPLTRVFDQQYMLERGAAFGRPARVTWLQHNGFIEIEFDLVVAQHCENRSAIALERILSSCTTGDGPFNSRVVGGSCCGRRDGTCFC